MKKLVKSKLAEQWGAILKTSCQTKKATLSLCSYTVNSMVPIITLCQQETEFSITLKMEKVENVLRITQFTLSDNPLLRELSADFYDAALLEIVLQALKCLFSYARSNKLDEVLFVLPQGEAIHVTCFEGLFNETSSLNFGQEKRVSLTLSCLFFDFAFSQIADIQAKIMQELWKAQRDDYFLRNYLQSHPKGTSLSVNKQTLSQENNTVILFSQSKRK